jgi:hypothetical protein
MDVATLCHGEIVCHVEIGFTSLQRGISQVAFPMGALIFITGLKLPAMLWSWGRLNLQKKMATTDIWWGEGGQCLGFGKIRYKRPALGSVHPSWIL